MLKKTIKKQPNKASSISLAFKYGAIFFLLMLSMIIVACASNTDSTTITGAATGTSTTTASKATPTINFSKVNQVSPTPALPAQWCGVWVTNESPAYNPGGSIPVYAYFKAQKDGNPVGIANASVTFTVQWGDLSGSYPFTAITTADGLAVAYIPMSGHQLALNKLSLITATFSSGNVTCSVGTDRPASFALVSGVTKASPTAKNR